MEKNSIEYIRKNGMPIAELIEKTGIPERTLKGRIRARGITPIGVISQLVFFHESDFDKIVHPGFRGPKRRSPAPDDV